MLRRLLDTAWVVRDLYRLYREKPPFMPAVVSDENIAAAEARLDEAHRYVVYGPSAEELPEGVYDLGAARQRRRKRRPGQSSQGGHQDGHCTVYVYDFRSSSG